ncbi:MAG: Calx-beta domain-containing protein, partial [Cyanobacteria bacterium P01_F01_bin.143]
YISFSPGEDTQTIEFQVFDDAELEGTETIELQLQTIPGLNDTFIGENSTATLEILDDEEVSYFDFAQIVYQGAENQQAEVNITRSGNLFNYTDVEVYWSDVTATEGLDYLNPFGQPQLVSFAPGEDTQTIVFDILDDPEFEGTETVSLQLQTLPGIPELALGSNSTATLEIIDDEDSIVGGSGNDTLDGGNGADILKGYNNNDSLIGGDGNDTLYGGNGADILEGNHDNDSLIGGNGNDTLYGENGADILKGNNNDDSLVGGDGNDTAYGGAGDDIIFGQNDDDRLFGNNGNDTLDGGVGADRLYGQNNDDSLVGGDGNDSLYGGNGADTLLGGNDNDKLFGKDGDDILIGGLGLDTLSGQAGSDRFRLESTTFENRDIINDFEDGIDFLELGSLDFGALTITQAGSNTNIIETATSETIAVVKGIDADNIDINDFI